MLDDNEDEEKIKNDIFLKNEPKENKIQFNKKLNLKNSIPVTIFTGYLGSGKTTIIVNLMKQVDSNYKIAWLKNEIGSTGVDTELANLEKTTMVKEMLQGCICHVMLSSLSEALDELIASKPDRIIIETSGSTTPATVVFEINKDNRLKMDGIITVIDAENFKGFLDKTFTLKLQAKYTDLILINKHEELDEKTLEDNLDDLYDINLNTPKIFTNKGKVSPEIVFGLGNGNYQDEDYVVSSFHQEMEVDLIELVPNYSYNRDELIKILKTYPKKYFFRIKGIVKSEKKYILINFAFGRFEIVELDKKNIEARIVFMGEELGDYQEKIKKDFPSSEKSFKYTKRHSHH